MKPRLLLLSDIWGSQKGQWIKSSQELLANKFEVKYYDSCTLGAIDTSIYTQEALHTQFVNGGVERAVKALVELEQSPVHLLAFSVGGTIAWKAIQDGLPAITLTAISATRLRYETEMIDTQVDLQYGINDPYMPEVDWFIKMKLAPLIHLNAGHDIYREEKFIRYLCKVKM